MSDNALVGGLKRTGFAPFVRNMLEDDLASVDAELRLMHERYQQLRDKRSHILRVLAELNQK